MSDPSSTRRNPPSDRHGVDRCSTLFSDVLDFDGVGFAVDIEPEDGTIRRHCGGMTSHREEKGEID